MLRWTFISIRYPFSVSAGRQHVQDQTECCDLVQTPARSRQPHSSRLWRCQLAHLFCHLQQMALGQRSEEKEAADMAPAANCSPALLGDSNNYISI